MADVTVTQVRSTNGASPRQRATLRSLRLGRIGKSASLADGPELRGMLRVVEHLVEVDGQTTKAGVKVHSGAASPSSPKSGGKA